MDQTFQNYRDGSRKLGELSFMPELGKSMASLANGKSLRDCVAIQICYEIKLKQKSHEIV
jgi:hypothetical protein